MTQRTDHATSVTPELGALAELVYLIDLALGDDCDPAVLVELNEAIHRAQQLLRERLLQHVQREPSADTAFAQLDLAAPPL